MGETNILMTKASQKTFSNVFPFYFNMGRSTTARQHSRWEAGRPHLYTCPHELMIFLVWLSVWGNFVSNESSAWLCSVHVHCVIVNGCPEWKHLCSSTQGYWMEGNMGSTSSQRICSFNGWLLNYLFVFTTLVVVCMSAYEFGVFPPVRVRDICGKRYTYG